MSDDCCCANEQPIMLLACSGGSNVGQLANQACVELTKEGHGQMFCLAGVGGKLPGFVAAARNAPSLVVIDGCEVGCAKAIFDEAGVPLRGYLVLTQEGIAKNKDFDLDPDQVAQVKDAVKRAVGPASTGGA